MDVLSLAEFLSQLALVGIFLYFVIAAVPMPDWARITCQMLLVLLFVLAAIQATIGPGPRRVPLLSPIPPGPASIIR